MSEKVVAVGVDIGARTNSVFWRENRPRGVHLEFPNTAAGHAKLLERLARTGRPVRICMESTGVYGLSLAFACDRTPNVEVMIVNPKRIRRFAEAGIARAKTDRLDAEVLAEYCSRMPFEAWAAPPALYLEFRAVVRRIGALTKGILREKARLHAAEQIGELTDFVRNDIEVSIRHTEKRILILRKKAFEIALSDPRLARQLELLKTVPGIAEVSSLRILAELALLPADMTTRQWVAYAGLDPRAQESGTSLRKKARISKMGNSHLRAALFLPAMTAVQRQENVREFHGRLVDRGKTPLLGIIAVMRKLLHSIHGMLRTDTEFIPEKFYRGAGTEALPQEPAPKPASGSTTHAIRTSPSA